MSAGASPQTPLKELTALPQIPQLVSRCRLAAGQDGNEGEGRKGLGGGERGREGKGGWGRRKKGRSWGNSALVVGGIDVPVHNL